MSETPSSSPGPRNRTGERSGRDACAANRSASSFDFADDVGDEERRLAALYRYDVLDSDPEEVFDDIAELAAQLFNAPIALVSLIDEDEQWFKSCIGLDRKRSGLDASLCIYAIQADGVTVIPDATDDERVAGTPMVVGEPGIRFYAGAPLTTSDGYRIGTLCVIDTQPREGIDESKARHLKRLAGIVVDEMELRREVQIRARHERELDESRRAEKQARRAAEEAQAEAEEANAAMARFFAGIAHDLQTPITRIQLFADLLKRSLDDETNRYIQKIHASSDRMSAMVQSLQDLAQVRSGQMMLDPEPTDVAEIVASACQATDADADATDRTLHTDVPGTPVRAQVDPDAFRRIIENLIGNALKYTDTGDRIDVSVTGPDPSGAEASDRVHVIVRDTGPGIDPDTLDTLFEPFTRGSDDTDGMGLGLAVSKDLAQAMDGDITVESTLGEGTRFEVTVPAV